MSIPTVAITNVSTVLSDAQVAAVLPALHKQVQFEFFNYWAQTCRLVFLAKDQPLPLSWWQILIINDPDQAGALGYHELSSAGTPLGKVFAKLDLDKGMSWTVTLSHELLEMLADPWINWIAEGSDLKLYALECGDPVEADELGWRIDGVLVSDFITPAWFEATSADRYDFKKHLSAPLTLAPGGYIGVLDPTQGWTQLTAEKAPSMPAMQVLAGVVENVIPAGSRRHRRTIPKQLWRKSER